MRKLYALCGVKPKMVVEPVHMYGHHVKDHLSLSKRSRKKTGDDTPNSRPSLASEHKYFVGSDRSYGLSFTRDSAGNLQFGRFKIDKALGSGAQAKVLLANDSSTNERYALKVIKKRIMSERSKKHISNEIVAMKTINHPHVVHLHEIHDDVVITTNNSSEVISAIVLVLDVCDGGELFDFMLYTGGFPERIARTYFAQICSAISACHAVGIYHRDIKPQNILLDSNFSVKITDFGLSALHMEEQDVCETYCGTMSYMAPEILAGTQYSGAKADAWSLGILLFFILAGNPPLKSATENDWWYNAILHRKMDRFWQAHVRLSPSFPPSAQEILSRLLVADPVDRASVMDIIDDPWLKGPILTSEELFETMTRRSKTMKALQEAENLKKHRRRQVETAEKESIDGLLNVPFEEETSMRSDSSPPKITTWKCQASIQCAFEDAFCDNPDGFYLDVEPTLGTVAMIRNMCTEAGAKLVQQLDMWTIEAVFEGKYDSSDTVKVHLSIYEAKKRAQLVTFVRVETGARSPRNARAVFTVLLKVALRQFNSQ